MRILNKALSLLAIGSMTLLAGCDAEKDLRLVEIPEKDIAYEQLYILGYSVQQYVDGDPFVSNTAVPMDPTDDPNVFTKRVEMYYYKDNKQFKFCDAQDDWNKIHYIVPESGVVDGTAYAYVEVGENANRGAVCSEGAGNLRDNFWGIREGEDGVYDVTINGKTLDISVVLVEKKEQPFAPEELYMVGDATTAGWNVSSPVPMEMTSPQVFEYTGPLYAGELKCPMQVSDKWEAPFIMPAVHETKINKNGVEAPECEYVPTGSPDSKWRIEEEGTYHLTIDCSKGKNEITIAAEYLGEIVRGPELYMLGNAVASFDSNNPLAMDYDDATGTFSWEGPIYFADKNATTELANKQFKFVSRPGNWDAVDYYIPEKAAADGYIGVIGEGTHKMKSCTWKNGSTGIDAFWGIASGKDGVYRIEVNLDAMTFTFTRTGNAEPQPDPELETELYMLGVAGRSGCDSNNPGVQMTRVGDTHTFTWDGELYYTEEEGNRQFNFITSKGNWDSVYFIVPEKGDSDQYRELVENGQTYKMKRIKGAGQPLSASWGIAKENNGRYRIEANLETMELKVTKLDNTTDKRIKSKKTHKMMKSHTLAAAALIATAFTAAAQELPENMYLIGDATAAGWNCNAPVKMQKVNDYEFTYTGELTKGEFKLPWVAGGDMWNSNTYMPMEAGTKVTKAGLKNSESYLTHNGQPDQKWVVEDAGVYTLTFKIDKDDTSFGALDATYVSELPKSIFMLGEAVGCFDSNAAIPVYEKDGKYVWTGALNYYGDDKLVKFCMTRGAWDQVTFMVPDQVDYNENVLQIEAGKTYSYQESAETEPGALKDWFWGIKEGQSGEYEITVDTDAKTVSFKLIKSYAFDKDNVTELYMLGLVAESFDSNHPLPMTSQGNGKFRWSGEIDYATTDGDEQHANKQFKFVTPKGDWNKVYYLVPAEAEADGFIQAIEPGSYPVKMTTWTDGKSGVDAFFGVKEGTKGEFTITVDVPNLTFTLTSGKSGIEAVKTADFSAMISGDILKVNGVEGEVSLYDVAGRKVLDTVAGTTDVSGLTDGIYVVTTAKGSVKIYKK